LACHRASFIEHGLVARDGVDVFRTAGVVVRGDGDRGAADDEDRRGNATRLESFVEFR
jgi:hypothetical protein